MDMLLLASLVAFAALVVGWMVLPARGPEGRETAASAPAMRVA